MTDTLVNRVIDLSREKPEKLAVIFKGEGLSFIQLANKAVAVSQVLKEHGVMRGDRVCFSAISKPETIVIYLAIHMIFAVAVFLDKNATPETMFDIYMASKSKLLLTDKQLKEYAGSCNVASIKEVFTKASDRKDFNLKDYKINPNEEELAEMLFTSGTTGKPKGVMLSYKGVLNILENTITGIGIKDSDVMLMPLPLNHSFALRVVRAFLYQGATLVLQNGFTFAKAVEDNVTKFGCNSMACVPASYEVMRGQMQDMFAKVLGHMRFIEFSAGSLSIQQRKTITALLPDVTIYNTWGSSESGGAIFCNVSEVVKDNEYIGALGKPLFGKVDIKILDENGNEICSSPEHPGRMALKGDMQMMGYWDNEEETNKTLVNGWLLTGDMAYLKDGYVFMLGRADNIINVGGEKVSPVEVENIAGQCPGVLECACIGVEDPQGVLGQVPALFVVAATGYDEDALKQFFVQRVERYKVPQCFRYIDKLPRNRMQKVDYKAIRMLWDKKDFEELMNPVIRNILSRRSIRKFSDKVISRDVIEMLVKCGYHAPSGHNMQSWRFTVLTKKSDIEELKQKTSMAASAENVYFYGFENPTAIILVSNDVRNKYGCQDASCAAENIMLAATSLGIGSVWLNPLMTLREVSPVKELLDEYAIPDNHIVWAMIALGYPVSEGVGLQKNEKVVNFI